MRWHAHRHRGPARTRAIFVLGLVVVSMAACADVFGLDDAGRRADAAGAGGRATQGGSAGKRPGTSGSGPRTGGTAGGSAGGSGAEPGGEGGSSAGTNGGSSLRGGGGSVGDNGGDSDNGGEEPAATEPGTQRLGGPCATDEDGDFACSDANPFLLLVCQGRVWVVRGTCDLDQRCDPQDPRCTTFDSVCADLEARGPICVGSDVFDCSPEHYATEHRVCPFGCRAGACDPGSETQLTLHTGVTPPTLETWAGRVPVCFATKSTGKEAGWVRDEVEHVYNRFLSIDFIGWGPCTKDPSGVMLSFVMLSFEDDCQGSLVNDIAPGKPEGDEALAVTICRSYRDNTDPADRVEDDESLIRLLARHQFAHVLGLLDGTDSRLTAVVRGVERGREKDLMLTAEDYLSLDSVLGKGFNRIATQNGTCLTASSEESGATVGAELCTSEPDLQVWKPATDRIRNRDSSWCFQSSGTNGDSITLQACKLTGDNQLVRLAHAQWRTPTRCVAPERVPPVEGTRLVTEPCRDAGDASQAWFFEILGDGDYAYYWSQIHFGESGLCVATPADGAWWDPVALSPCATAPLPPNIGTDLEPDPHVVRIGPEGIKGASANCLNWQEAGGLLALGQCGTSFSHYFVSGPLEGANGLALSLEDSGELVAKILGTPPTPDQIFDVYF